MTPPPETRILALWAHPRSRSTALERVFMERGDFHVLHEPFAGLYYVQDQKATAVSADYDESQAFDYASIRQRILDASRTSPVFLKDMAYHGFQPLCEDTDFLRRLEHIFLIRDPRDAIASHFAKNPQVTLEEIGYQRQAELYAKVSDVTGNTPPVIQAEDLVAAPAQTLQQLCHRLRISHDPTALQWQPGSPEEWRPWKTWHDVAATSQGLHDVTTHYEITVDNNDWLRRCYEHHLPYYTALSRAARHPGAAPT